MESRARSRNSRENRSSARSANPAGSISSHKLNKSHVSYASHTSNTSVRSKSTSALKSNNRSNKSNRSVNSANYVNYVKSNRRQNIENIKNINYIDNINMAGVGVLNIPGRVRTRSADLDRYRERARESQKFPNRRRKIITGKDLTTPLRRAKVKEKKVYPVIITLPKQKKRFPFGVISCLFACTIALSCLIWSYMVLNKYSHDINNENREIAKVEKLERDLESELEAKNDLTYFVEVAVNELGMVKEELLPKYYIAVKSKDKAEIVEESDNIIFRLPGILSALLGEK